MSNLKQKFNDLLKSDLNKRIFSHSFWILSGNILSKAILLVATILMAKYLNKHEYGQFGIIKSTILMFAMFAGMELGITATKYISQYKVTNPSKVEKIVGLSNFFAITISIIISIIVFVFAKEIAKQINAPALFPEIRISSFILFFSSLNGIQNGILAGLEKFKVISINSAIAGVISSVFMIVASVYGDLELITIAFGSNFVILFLLNFISLKTNFFSEYNIQIFSKRNFDEVHVLWKFSLPAILAG
ncbi:oligosaccharide flippase family protein [Chryseobacterium tructae]|nr:oligosaccharide flippase family protein [Chryseobacterium tructae]MDN3691664.1 oligosaccharide flippase family protein [Chryseobacterium tructae]